MNKINNSGKAVLASPGMSIKNAAEDGDFPAVEITAYTGEAVSLAGYPHYIDEPVVYNTEGIKLRDRIPYLENHFESSILGHTISNTKEQGEIKTRALHSDPGENTKEVFQRMKNGIPYQASMGLEVNGEDVIFVADGEVQVNNRTFKAPIFVVNKSELVEVSATLFGRDSDTEITALSKDYQQGKDLLMRIKNSSSAPAGENNTPTGKVENTTPSPEKEGKEATTTTKVENTTIPAETPVVTTTKVENTAATPPTPAPNDQMWLFDYIEHPDLIKNARKEGWDKGKFEVELAKKEAKEIENSYPGVPDVYIPTKDVDNALLGRFALSVGVSPEKVQKELGEKTAQYSHDAGNVGLKETMMMIGNSTGGHFNGHSDVEPLCDHIKGHYIQNRAKGLYRNRRINNVGFSTLDFPNFMNRVTQWRKDEMWELEKPQAPGLCKAETANDLKDLGRAKMKGGKIWEGFDDDGKIKHGTMGDEDTYTTSINTFAQIVTFKRDHIINDDIGWVDDALTLMLEGAIMLPDYMLVDRIYEAETAGKLNTSGDSQSKFTLALTRANLSTVYNTVRRRYTTKKSSDADKTVNGRFNTRWALVVGPDLEETAWEILKQSRIVNDTTANTKTGEKNYWFERLDLVVLDNLDNTTYHSSAAGDNWALWPKNARLSPFYIRYLNNQRSPMTEVVDLPADMLGFGTRGVWDVNIDYRDVEGGKLQAYAWSDPA